MLPEVEKYYDAVSDSDDNWALKQEAGRQNPVPTWSPSLVKEKRDEYFAAVERREAALRALDREQKEREATALEGLVASDNPLVRWIATTEEVMNNYSSHAKSVLCALPMTREEIDDFGDVNGWCGEYREFLRMAEAASVLPAPTPDLADIEPLVQEFVNWHGSRYESQIRKKIKKHLPALIDSANQRADV
jgi:hypothetical protein